MKDLSAKTWLADLVAAELAAYDPAVARARLPPEVRGDHPESPSAEARARVLVVRSLRLKNVSAPGEADDLTAFLGPLRGHVALLLDLALVQNGSYEAGRRSAELAAFFAAAAGEVDAALAADPTRPAASEAATRKAFRDAGAVWRARGFPPGDPPLGLPLRAGSLAVERRLLARVAMAFYRKGKLEPDAVRRHLDFAHRELALLAESLCGLACADHPVSAQQRRGFLRQVARLDLPATRDRAARAGVEKPRSPREVARAAGPKIRPFLLEQLLLAALADGRGSPQEVAFVRAFAEAAGVTAEQLVSMQAEAAAYYAANKEWLDAFVTSDMAQELRDDLAERLVNAVTDNLEAIATEIKETGELGQLLAKAAAGTGLDDKEKRRVKEQLLDLAKAVPALAIFAAPGGMILLPLLAKLLPFNMLPSAFHAERERAPDDKAG